MSCPAGRGGKGQLAKHPKWKHIRCRINCHIEDHYKHYALLGKCSISWFLVPILIGVYFMYYFRPLTMVTTKSIFSWCVVLNYFSQERFADELLFLEERCIFINTCWNSRRFWISFFIQPTTKVMRPALSLYGVYSPFVFIVLSIYNFGFWCFFPYLLAFKHILCMFMRTKMCQDQKKMQLL